MDFVRKFPHAPSYITKAMIGSTLSPQLADESIMHALQGLKPKVPQPTSQQAIQQLAQNNPNSVSNAFRNLGQASQAGAIGLGAHVPTALGLGAVGGAAVGAGYLIDRSLKKLPQPTSLGEAAQTIRKSPGKAVQQAGKGIKFLQENLGKSFTIQDLQKLVGKTAYASDPIVGTPDPGELMQMEFDARDDNTPPEEDPTIEPAPIISPVPEEAQREKDEVDAAIYDKIDLDNIMRKGQDEADAYMIDWQRRAKDEYDRRVKAGLPVPDPSDPKYRKFPDHPEWDADNFFDDIQDLVPAEPKPTPPPNAGKFDPGLANVRQQINRGKAGAEALRARALRPTSKQPLKQAAKGAKFLKENLLAQKGTTDRDKKKGQDLIDQLNDQISKGKSEDDVKAIINRGGLPPNIKNKLIVYMGHLKAIHNIRKGTGAGDKTEEAYRKRLKDQGFSDAYIDAVGKGKYPPFDEFDKKPIR